MINFIDVCKDTPYFKFLDFYKRAILKKQRNIEAISISSFNDNRKEVESRYVNLKYIRGQEWIFFSNYHSPKSESFSSHKQISAILFWESINLQIRIKAKIYKTDSDFSDYHFSKRSLSKNALAISSFQSKPIESFDIVKDNFENVLKKKEILIKRPDYWGGFSFEPYYFEFWEGGSNRLNKREAFLKDKKKWTHSYLQP
jgi:pyridoxamine 5'-phosphate oxidase